MVQTLKEVQTPKEVQILKEVQLRKVSAVLSETILLCRVSRALATQEEASANFPGALRELPPASHRVHHAAVKTPESRMRVVCLKRANQNVWMIRTKASLLFLVPETQLFSDQEFSDQETRLFVDQGMDMVLAKHWLVLPAEVVDDHQDKEVKEWDNDRIQKCQQCVDCQLMD